MTKRKKTEKQKNQLTKTTQSKEVRQKKAKKSKKSLKKNINVCSNTPTQRNDKSKKDHITKDAFSTIQPKGSKSKKKVAFDEDSSDSYFEPIEASWSADDMLEDSGDQWLSSNKVAECSTSDEKQSGTESSSNDLEESEDDQDEELSEEDLNTLLNTKQKPVKPKSKCQQKESSNAMKRALEPTGNAAPSAKKMKVTDNSKFAGGTNAGGNADKASSIVGWANKSAMLEEIKKRAIELASITLYVSPIPSNCTESMLKTLSPTMVSYRLSIKNKTKLPRLFAFLQYADMDSAVAARKAICGRLFGGKTVSAHPNHLPFTNDLDTQYVNQNQLFVTGFGSSVTKSELSHIFPKGNIEFPVTKDGRPCGYAVVTFVNENVTAEAFLTTHKRLVRGLPIFVNFVIKSSSLSKEGSKPTNEAAAANKNQSPVIKKQEKVKETLREEKSRLVPAAGDKKSSCDTTVVNTTTTTASSVNNKVLVRQLPPEADDDDGSESSSEDVSEDESEADGFLVRCQPQKNDTTGSGTSILNNLVTSKTLSKKTLAMSEEKKQKSIAAEQNDDDYDSDSEQDDDDDEESDVDEDETSDEDSEEENDDESDDEELDDEDDDDDSDGTIESEDDSITPKSGKASVADKSELFTPPSSANSSDENIDNELMAVIQAKRSAKKSFKSFGGKRKWNYSGSNNKKNAVKDFENNVKPQMVSVYC
ncbi:unnamed protein product [Heterobilharzia americana]|nr:unnamed protein product [Heterobilharzia americana]